MVYSSLFILLLITLKCLGQDESTGRDIALPLALALALTAAAVSGLINMLKFYVKVLRVTRITEIPEYYQNTGIPVKNIGIPLKDTY